METKFCLWCATEFVPCRHNQKYCQKTCRRNAWIKEKRLQEKRLQTPDEKRLQTGEAPTRSIDTKSIE